MERTILHCDVNNFYASVAIKNNPALKDKALVICGDPEKRHGIVLAKSNAAKKAGIITGDTVLEAKRKASGLVILPPDYKQYMYFSNLIYNIYKEYTPLVESFGLDECWLDISGTEKLFGDGVTVANIIRNRIKNEIGLTISVGVSFTKVFAKLGSDYKKPDAVTVINRSNYKQIAWKLPVTDMLMVGRSLATNLSKMKILTIGDLANTPINVLVSKLGKIGEVLFYYANGQDTEQVSEYNIERLPKSVSNGSTTEADITTFREATSLVYSLSDIVAFRLRRYGLVATGIALYLKDNLLQSFARQKKLYLPIDDEQSIAEEALGILKNNYSFSENRPLRSITVGCYGLIPSGGERQISIFEKSDSKNENIDKSLDKIRKKYGFNSLKRAIEMDDTYTCDAHEVEDGYLPFDKSKNTSLD